MRMGPDEVWGGEARENKVVLNVDVKQLNMSGAMSEHGELRWWQIGTHADCWSVTPSSASVPRSNTFQLYHHSSSEAWNFWWATLLPAWARAFWWYRWRVLSQLATFLLGVYHGWWLPHPCHRPATKPWEYEDMSQVEIAQEACDQMKDTVHSFMESSKLGLYNAEQ